MAGNNGAIKLVAGNSNPALAQAIADGLGLALTKAFMRISDSKLRRRIVDLVEQIAVSDKI